MNKYELFELLNNNGANNHYYNIVETVMVEINGHFFSCQMIFLNINEFIEEYINNFHIKNMIYVYDIGDNYVRFFESNEICEKKKQDFRNKKIKQLINKLI